jgi:predicted nucleotidyltransferase
MMPSTVQKLTKKGLIRPPDFLPTNIHYETTMGSVAYGVSSDTSDMDVYGWCIPPKDIIFPHLTGEILGFGRQKKRFGQYEQHHVLVEDAMGGKGRNYDLSIYNIVKYFQLCMDNNPNMVDSMFTPVECVLHITQVGNMVREARHIFLHKGCWQRFKGYAYSQLSKMKKSEPQGKRKAIIDEYGFDIKNAYHIVRLLDECEQILTYGDLDLRRAKEHMKAVRRGDINEVEIREWFTHKEKQLETLYHKEPSPIPYAPDETKIKTLLLQCLEHHYGSLDNCIVNPDAAVQALREVQEVLNKNKGLL